MTEAAPDISVPTSRKPPLQRGNLELAKKTKPFRILDFLWRRGPLILGICVPVALILIVLVTPFATSSYRVAGTLLIKPVKEPMINGGVRDVIQGDVGFFQRTLVLRMSDVEVLRTAIEAVPESKRPKFITSAPTLDRAAYRLMSRLKSREVDRTYLIQIALEDTDPHGLAEILSAVLQSLVDKLHREQERQYEARLTYLKGEREKIAARADDEKVRILKLADTVENKSFLHDAYTAHLGKVEVIQRLYWEALALAVDKEALFNKAVADQRELEKFSLAPFAQERVTDNFGINQIEQWTYGKSQELRSNIDGLTPGNPDRKYVEARMASMNEYLANYKKAVGDATIKNLSEKRRFELETEVAKTRNAYEAAQSGARQLQEQLDAAADEASKISEAIFLAKDMNYGITQLRERLASINTRIDDAELEAKSPLPVSIDEMPVKPGEPASSNAGKLRMLILAATFGLVGGLCLAFDFLDGRIRSREELAAALGGPGAEPIPALSEVTSEVPFSVFLSNHPSHPAALSISDLALRLALERERSGARTIAFVGLHSQAGTTAIALAVSRGLSAHGLRVLHAELPTETPGLAAAAGLTASHSSKREKAMGLPLFSDPHGGRVILLPWNKASDPTQVRSGLGEFLEKRRENCDVVVLDLVPLAASDLAHEAAIKSDVVVVVGKQDVARYAVARQTVEWLAAGSVPAVTVLLNFTTPNSIREGAMTWFAKGQNLASRLHPLFEEKAGNFLTEQWEKIRKNTK